MTVVSSTFRGISLHKPEPMKMCMAVARILWKERWLLKLSVCQSLSTKVAFALLHMLVLTVIHGLDAV